MSAETAVDKAEAERLYWARQAGIRLALVNLSERSDRDTTYDYELQFSQKQSMYLVDTYTTRI